MKIESIADIAKRNIQKWVVTGHFQPGKQIKEEEISEEEQAQWDFPEVDIDDKK